MKFNQIFSRGAPILAAALLTLTPQARADLAPTPWDSTVRYEVLQSNPSGAIPKVGENVAIRFRGSYKGTEFDNTMKADNPYFVRAGAGILLKGLDDAVPNMHVGDRYHLVFGGDLAFGAKGRSSSPGKPRIPPMADVDFEVVLESIPGSEEEFISDYGDVVEEME
eukprot:CAMPEP_0173294086 /NCGR_PEP_ID=MMETSP1143-20121109/13675_1 /TAXON_ID=483371 /ORGANISM="non described non described, Strain CCMP2298" /LENGTH=165 /DNA_ID=CAMNT_0014233719 /DNA_START=144 /DNA_END=641 /DNA_ORIENTATION=+